uniref:Uncharacterized protein n=1 Tax=Anopheles coluzzii TaxID=1518534 RepID=A0A8W7P059_ANOCL
MAATGRLPRTLSADELAQLGQLGLQVLVAVLERLDPLAVLEILRHQYVDPALQLVHDDWREVELPDWLPPAVLPIDGPAPVPPLACSDVRRLEAVELAPLDVLP